MKVPTSGWAMRIIPIVKKSGNIRICGDFKVTRTPPLQIEQYPRNEDICASLSGGDQLTKMDLPQANLQLEVNEDKQNNKKGYLITTNTHKGI